MTPLNWLVFFKEISSLLIEGNFYDLELPEELIFVVM